MIIYTIITCILIGSAYHYWKQITTSKKVEPFKWKKDKKAVKKVENTFSVSSSSSSIPLGIDIISPSKPLMDDLNRIVVICSSPFCDLVRDEICVVIYIIQILFFCTILPKDSSNTI